LEEGDNVLWGLDTEKTHKNQGQKILRKKTFLLDGGMCQVCVMMKKQKKNFIIKENHQLFYSARGCKFKTFRNSVISSGITTLFLPSFEHKQKECLKFPFGRGPPL